MDPYAKFGLQFTPPPFEEFDEELAALNPPLDGGDNVVTLDTFRKK
jgi:hypothetical protein